MGFRFGLTVALLQCVISHADQQSWSQSTSLVVSKDESGLKPAFKMNAGLTGPVARRLRSTDLKLPSFATAYVKNKKQKTNNNKDTGNSKLLPGFASSYMKAGRTHHAKPDDDDDDNDISSGAKGTAFKFIRLDADLPGRQLSTLTRADEMALIGAVAGTIKGEDMDEVSITHTSEWAKPLRVIVEFQVRVESDKRKATLLAYFKSKTFKNKATASFIANTNEKGSISFSEPVEKSGPPTGELTTREVVQTAAVGAGCAIVFACFLLAVQRQCTEKSDKTDLGIERKYRSLQGGGANNGE